MDARRSGGEGCPVCSFTPFQPVPFSLCQHLPAINDPCSAWCCAVVSMTVVYRPRNFVWPLSPLHSSSCLHNIFKSRPSQKARGFAHSRLGKLVSLVRIPSRMHHKSRLYLVFIHRQVDNFLLLHGAFMVLKDAPCHDHVASMTPCEEILEDGGSDAGFHD